MTPNERTAHANTQTFGLVLISAALLVAVLPGFGPIRT